MSKAVLISINPKWCELIASGEKTIEVRKTRPKLETPFKCYIYCTASNVHECLMQSKGGVKLVAALNYKTAIPVGGNIANGKVIGEFVCDRISEIMISCSDPEMKGRPLPGMGMTDRDIMDYLGNGKTGFGWRISALKIYDNPQGLSSLGIGWPPQSWCYVEEMEG